MQDWIKNPYGKVQTTEGLNFEAETDQYYVDHWRQRVRKCEYKGKCPTCGKRMYAFDDGENDPRGPLGDHAAVHHEAADSDMVGEDVYVCWECYDDTDMYAVIMKVVRLTGDWKPKPKA